MSEKAERPSGRREMIEGNPGLAGSRLQTHHIADHPVEADRKQALILPVLLLQVDAQESCLAGGKGERVSQGGVGPWKSTKIGLSEIVALVE